MADQNTWPPAQPFGGRQADVEHLLAATAEGHCSSLVGMSNVGKSFVLRTLCREAGLATLPAIFVYIDCNRMVEFSEQGFYELVLRCVRATLPAAHEGSGVAARLEQCYNDIVAPSTPFAAHLGFSEAIAAACEGIDSRLVLVLDEFDQVMVGIDDRVLLNLRALRDTYPQKLSYITATGHRLRALRGTHGSQEFAELFNQSTRFLAPLDPAAAKALIGHWSAERSLLLSPNDAPLLLEETGGHPALLAAACHALSTLRHEAQAVQRHLLADQIRSQFDTDAACEAECARFWQELSQDERRLLLHEQAEDSAMIPARQALLERHLAVKSEGQLWPFCRIFAGYVRRRRLVRQPEARGVRVDVEAGEVSVDGRVIPALTDLEYRLLLLLYGRLDKLVDKYEVVQAVWGQDYIDEVDDARIDKLVSRLRQKLEANPAEPKYLLTIRGRGYKLVGP